MKNKRTTYGRPRLSTLHDIYPTSITRIVIFFSSPYMFILTGRIPGLGALCSFANDLTREAHILYKEIRAEYE